MELHSIDAIIEDLRQGRMAVLMDDEARENEGDLILVAEHVTPNDINFMAGYARGLICLTLSKQRCQQLRLPLMVAENHAAHATNFTVSIEAARGVTTGISAADRATTVQAAVAHDAKPEDLVQPGHIFPLMAEDGGVLTRAGHTEAGCDLARLAGFQPAAVIVEILNEDGSMARRHDLQKFAEAHQLKIGTIEELIRYRLKHEKSIERVAEVEFPTRFGKFHLMAYQDRIAGRVHLALVNGEIRPDQTTLVRVHVEDLLGDTLAGSHQLGWPLHDAMQRLANAEEPAVLVMLREDQSPRQLVRQIQQLPRREIRNDLDTDDDMPVDWRTYGIGAQILADLGVQTMRVLSAPKIFHGLAGFGLEIVDYVSE